MGKPSWAATSEVVAVALVAMICLAARTANAEQSVGGAEVVVNQVNGSLSSGDVVLVSQGDGVYRNEQVRTGNESFVRLLLADKTSLALGPSSALKIDKFVYGGEGQSGKIAINIAKGALRFVTGDAAKSAYAITTPTATLGVRGTILRIRVTPARTDVLLEEGGAQVCVSKSGDRHCAVLSNANAVASVTTTAVTVSTATPATMKEFSVPSPTTNSPTNTNHNGNAHSSSGASSPHQ